MLVPIFVDGECECVGNATPGFTAACYRLIGLPLSVPYLKGRPHVTVRYGRPIDARHGDFEAVARAFWVELATLRTDSIADSLPPGEKGN